MSRPCVLLVDDDAGTVETLADILRAKAYQVGVANSGEAAVDMVKRSRYDAILMDIVMPGLNGVEALRAIKASAPQINVIMMTAFTRHELVQEARRQNAAAVLPKPLEMDRVLALLERVTHRNAEPGGADR